MSDLQSDKTDEVSAESAKKKRKISLKTLATVLIVIAFIVSVAVYAVLINEDEEDRIVGVAEDAAEEFLNDGFQPYLDDIIEKCGLSDLTAEFAVDYDSLQKLTLSIEFNINVSFFSDEIDDYYCDNKSTDNARTDELRTLMRDFSEGAGSLDNAIFEFAASEDDYVRIHLYVDYHRITTSDGREYYYIDTDSYEELAIDGTEIFYNGYPDAPGPLNDQ